MKSSCGRIVLAALALGLTLGCSAATDPSAPDDSAERAATASREEAPASDDPCTIDEQRQATIDHAMTNLDREISDQLARGAIDRDALAAAIDAVVATFPEADRVDVRATIDDAIDADERLASQMSAMSPDQGKQHAQPPPASPPPRSTTTPPPTPRPPTSVTTPPPTSSPPTSVTTPPRMEPQPPSAPPSGLEWNWGLNPGAWEWGWSASDRRWGWHWNPNRSSWGWGFHPRR